MKLKFTATGGFDSYEEFTDGACLEVTEERAKYLLATFPGHFSAPAQKEEPAPTSNKAARRPTSNR